MGGAASIIVGRVSMQVVGVALQTPKVKSHEINRNKSRNGAETPSREDQYEVCCDTKDRVRQCHSYTLTAEWCTLVVWVYDQ